MEEYNIEEFIPQFRELNEAYEAVIGRKALTKTDQITVTQFYGQYQDIKAFEQMLIRLDYSDENTYQKLTVLQSQAKKNIRQYEENKTFLSSIDIDKELFEEQILSYERDVQKEQNGVDLLREKAEVAKLENELKILIRNNQSDIDVQNKKRQLAEAQKWYDHEKTFVKAVEQRLNDYINEIAPYTQNLFPDMYKLSQKMIDVMKDYAVDKQKVTNDEKSEKGEKEKAGVEKENYFGMRLIGAIHQVCNNQQFEQAGDTDYYRFFNLTQINDKPLQIKSGNKVKVYYLLYKMEQYLYDTLHLSKNEVEFWIDAVLKSLQIEKGIYSKKKSFVLSKDANDELNAFGETINEIFQQYG